MVQLRDEPYEAVKDQVVSTNSITPFILNITLTLYLGSGSSIAIIHSRFGRAQCTPD